MEEKSVVLQNRGMWQDNAISKSPEEFAYENNNIRITSTGDGTQLAVTNEKDSWRSVSISGKYLGGCRIGDYYVAFTTMQKIQDNEQVDTIYLIDFSNIEESGSPSYGILYEGNLGFDSNHPIECMPWYESEGIQKVYWVDGINITRVINIMGDINGDDDNQFDFKASLKWQNAIPRVDISKDYDVPGMFTQGTVQYFITYYKKFYSETGIVWMSSVQYISLKDRGAKADENVNVSFNIEIYNLDRNFDYVRVYSAYRSSYNGAVSLRVVGDIEIPTDEEITTISITDTGTNGYAVDPSILQFIGGQDIVAETMTQKDGVLFLGNINANVGNSGENFKKAKEYIESTIRRINKATETTVFSKERINQSTLLYFTHKIIPVEVKNGYYSHTQQINKSEYCIKTFKRGEIYRFAIQLMDRKCIWSTPIWCGDLECTVYPRYDNGVFEVPTVVTDPSVFQDFSYEMSGYVAYRILYAEMSAATRSIVAQGVVNPTLFNYNDRYNNKPFAFNSWNFRPRNSGISNIHLESIGTQDTENAELQGLSIEKSPIVDITKLQKSKYEYYSMIMGFDEGHEVQFRLVFFNATKDQITAVLNGGGKITDYMSIIKNDDDGYVKTKHWSDSLSEAYSRLKRFYDDGDTHKSEDFPLSVDVLPNASTAKSIASILLLSNLARVMEVMAWAANIGLGVIRGAFNPSVAASLIFDHITKIKNWSIDKAVVAMSAVGRDLVRKSASKGRNNIEKSMASAGWVYVGESSDVSGYSRLFTGGDAVPQFKKFKGKNDGSFWVTGGKLSDVRADLEEANKRLEQFYVDENIVTLNSPDIEGNEDLINNNSQLKLRIIGSASIDSIYSDNIIETEKSGHAVNSGVVMSDTDTSSPIGEPVKDGLLSGYLYQDSFVQGNNQVLGDNYDKYKVFLWNRETSLSVGGGIPTLGLGDAAKLKRKIFANMRYSLFTDYTESVNWIQKYNILTPKVYNDDGTITTINNGFRDVFYSGSYDNVVAFTQSNKYPVLTENDESFLSDDSMKITDPVRVKFSSTQHAVMSLGRSESGINILPYNYTIPPKRGIYKHFAESLDQWEVGYENFAKGILDDTFVFPTGTTGTNVVNLTNTTGYTFYMDEHGDYRIDMIPGDRSTINKLFDAAASYMLNDDGSKASATEDDVTVLCRDLNREEKMFMLPARVIYEGNEFKCYISIYCMVKAAPEYYVYTPKQLEGVVVNIYDIYKSKTVESEGVTNHIKQLEAKYLVTDHYNFTTCGGLMPYIYRSILKYSFFNNKQITEPYLLIGELYRDIPYGNLWGGFDEDSMKNIRWNVCSSNTNIDENITVTWGDTYYQRWDCLKTYPKTEEDANGIVDIFSFMVETRKNLDGRCDVNRGVYNILNARPTNWNLMNDVYNQENNLFTYSILDSKFNTSEYKNQIVWSTKKVDLSDIDTFTNINTMSSLSLDGKYGKITKLENMNNTVIAFQEDAISSIRFNVRTQLSTEQGLPVEVANSGKVDGYDIITEHSGCLNKLHECKGSSGVYFIDGNRKTIMRLSKEGVENLGMKAGMSSFFTRNANDVKRMFYDELTNDIYITGNKDSAVNYCMNYNELTSSFVSFLPYNLALSNICVRGESYMINSPQTMTFIDKMFIDKYSTKYSISYRVNPEPYIDKIFTTVDYVADVFDSEGKYLYDVNPLSAISAETEYQSGYVEIPQFDKKLFRGSDERKFRIRRIQIPRDMNSRHGLDRIRNPWCKITFNGNPKNRLVFHEAFVRYYR